MKVTTSTERLKELLNSDSRSYTSIASKLHVSKQIVSAWAKGLRSPKKDTLIKIAEMYNVSIDWLMGFDVEKTPHSKPDYEAELEDRVDKLQTIEARILATGIDNMPKEQREQALNIMKAIFVQFADRFENKEKDDET